MKSWGCELAQRSRVGRLPELGCKNFHRAMWGCRKPHRSVSRAQPPPTAPYRRQVTDMIQHHCGSDIHTHRLHLEVFQQQTIPVLSRQQRGQQLSVDVTLRRRVGSLDQPPARSRNPTGRRRRQRRFGRSGRGAGGAAGAWAHGAASRAHNRPAPAGKAFKTPNL